MKRVPGASPSGRSANVVERAMAAARGPILCADIGGSFIHAALADGQALSRNVRVPTPAGNYRDFVAALSGIIEGFRDRLPATAPLCLSIAGFVDPESGVLTSANLPCLNGHPLAAELGDALRRPVIAANDADCFTLAEATSGAGQGRRVVFGAILGTGVGGGLVVEGRLVRGAGGVAGEWGHGPIVTRHSRSGRFIPRFRCGCGRLGCLDTVGGARGLERLDAFLSGQAPRDSRAILAAWKAGEKAAAETVETYVDLLVEPLALVVNITGAAVVPLGGGLAANAALVAALESGLRGLVLRKDDAPIVVPARFQADGGLRGSVLLATEFG